MERLFSGSVDMVCDIDDVDELFGAENVVAVTTSPTAEPTALPTEEDRSALVTMQCDDVLTAYISEDGGASWRLHSTNTRWYIPVIVELDEATEDTMVFADCHNSDDGAGGFIATVLRQEAEYSTTNPLRDGFWEIVNATNDVVAPLLYQVADALTLSLSVFPDSCSMNMFLCVFCGSKVVCFLLQIQNETSLLTHFFSFCALTMAFHKVTRVVTVLFTVFSPKWTVFGTATLRESARMRFGSGTGAL